MQTFPTGRCGSGMNYRMQQRDKAQLWKKDETSSPWGTSKSDLTWTQSSRVWDAGLQGAPQAMYLIRIRNGTSFIFHFATQFRIWKSTVTTDYAGCWEDFQTTQRKCIKLFSSNHYGNKMPNWKSHSDIYVCGGTHFYRRTRMFHDRLPILTEVSIM